MNTEKLAISRTEAILRWAKKNEAFFVAGVVLLAILIRLWGISPDLPYIYHPDEPVAISISLDMFRTGDLNPRFFHWPSLIFYINALAYVPYYLAGKLLGVFHNPNDILSLTSLAMGVTRAELPGIVLLGRLVTVFFGSLNVLIVFLIGKRLLRSSGVGLLAAVMMAVSPSNVTNSRYIAPDTYATFFVLLSLLISTQLLHYGRTRDYIAAGVVVGLAASSKYNGGLVIAALILAHFLRRDSRGFRDYRLYMALFISLGSFLLTTPFAALDSDKFLTDLQFDATHYSTGHTGMEGEPLRWYLSHLWRVEGPIVILAALGIVQVIWSRSKERWVAVVFPVIYFALISRLVVRNERTLLPMVPFLFLFASLMVFFLWSQIGRARSRIRPALLRTAIVGLIIVCVALPFSVTLQRGIRLATVDSRETARIWIQSNLPPHTKIAVESYSPFVDPESFSVQGFEQIIDHPPGWYAENGFDYLVLAESMFGRFYADPERYAEQISLYDAFHKAYPLLKEFNDGDYLVKIFDVSGLEE
jgi:hypothetical protein